MNKPELLLALRKVFFEGKWHLRCINCGSTTVDQWNWNETWDLRFSSSKEYVSISLPAEDCETSGIPAGPRIVYGMDPVVESLTATNRTHAIVAQNHVVVVSNDDLHNVELPIFLSNEPTSLERIELVVNFDSPVLGELPDVRVFENRMRSNRSGDDDLRLFDSRRSDGDRIPVGLLLPATIAVDNKQKQVVFSIKEWRSDNEAIITCFSPTPVTANGKETLMREVFVDGHSIEARLGTVVELLPI